MYKYFIFCGLMLIMACKSDHSGHEEELMEISDDTAGHNVGDLVTTDEILDVPEIHRGRIEQIDGKFVIRATALISATLKEDYNNIDGVMDSYPETFTVTVKKTGDTPSSQKDSVVTMKYKTSYIEFRKRKGMQDRLLIASLQNENFMLQNGLHTGIDRAEALAKFGIREQIPQDLIEVVSSENNDKILLFLNKDTLVKIEIIPSLKE
ncbi:MAG TPA: hypothetical protein PLA95_12600 [Saprospiraceae bacterium]|nr:MAG: hypothetical protein UZ08_BCD001002590 [Candidatus Parvibacillus calidus]HNI94158.1 hypothetical protein [Saprospiraceae bacterium]